MCNGLLLDGFAFTGLSLDDPPDATKEAERATKYFPSAEILAEDCVVFPSIHALHFYLTHDV